MKLNTTNNTDLGVTYIPIRLADKRTLKKSDNYSINIIHDEVSKKIKLESSISTYMKNEKDNIHNISDINDYDIREKYLANIFRFL